MNTEVRNNTASSRYEILVDGTLAGIADYHQRDDRLIVMPHTEIDPARRGQGLGAILVKGALDDLRRLGATVVPSCWYVREFVEANPEYADLIS